MLDILIIQDIYNTTLIYNVNTICKMNFQTETVFKSCNISYCPKCGVADKILSRSSNNAKSNLMVSSHGVKSNKSTMTPVNVDDNKTLSKSVTNASVSKKVTKKVTKKIPKDLSKSLPRNLATSFNSKKRKYYDSTDDEDETNDIKYEVKTRSMSLSSAITRANVPCIMELQKSRLNEILKKDQ